MRWTDLSPHHSTLSIGCGIVSRQQVPPDRFPPCISSVRYSDILFTYILNIQSREEMVSEAKKWGIFLCDILNRAPPLLPKRRTWTTATGTTILQFSPSLCFTFSIQFCFLLSYLVFISHLLLPLLLLLLLLCFVWPLFCFVSDLFFLVYTSISAAHTSGQNK